MLTEQKFLNEQILACDRIRKAMPFLNLDQRVIEIADFSLANPGYEAGATFKRDREKLKDGLFNRIGLEIHLIANTDDMPVIGGTGIDQGYCGKILVWEPGQFLPDHRHQTVYVIEKDVRALDYLTNLKEVNPEFGIVGGVLEGFPLADFNYFVPKAVGGLNKGQEKEISKILGMHDGTIKIGKRETFFVVYGDGYYIGPSIGHNREARINEGTDVWNRIPESQRRYVHQVDDRRTIHMKSGGIYHLPTNTSHAVVAGQGGMVAFEFSKKSWDPADIFTDPNIRRETKILMPDNR